MAVHYAVELFPLFNNGKENVQRHRTVGSHNSHIPGAIRLDDVAAAGRCPIGSLLYAADDSVFDPRHCTLAIEVHHAC